MAMMVGAPHWYSLDFEVSEAKRHLAHAELSAWREKGTLTIGGIAHRVYPEGLHGDFLLERDGRVLVRATKPSALRHRLLIRHRRRDLRARQAVVLGAHVRRPRRRHRDRLAHAHQHVAPQSRRDAAGGVVPAAQDLRHLADGHPLAA